MNNQLTLFDNKSDFYESDVSNFDRKTAVFRVHASLIYKLGESLIADEVTALSELIKNAYDADARFCSLSIDTNYVETINGSLCKGKIELADNGSGMDLQTIVNGWLTLSNSPKKKMKKEKKTTPKYHRYPLGDKGLGRLSVQKLGRHMQMTTKCADSNIEYTLIIPWGDFLKNTTIDQIPVDITEKEVLDNKSYTKIVIKDLLNSELWEDKEQINILGNSINKIVSPFRSKESSFRVVASVNGEPIDAIDTIFDDLLSRARARHIITYKNGKSTLRSFYTQSFFFNREMIDKILQNRFAMNNSTLADFWESHRAKLTLFKYVPNEKEVFTSSDACLFEEIVYGSNEGEDTSDPGEFECEIYEYTLDNRFLENFYKNISYSELIDQNEYKEFIARFHGIKVVRDGFIVQGFGDGDGGDWLGLSSSSKTTGSFFDFSNDSVIGCVYLTGDKNSVLKETTNREGFVGDKYYVAFKRILNESIKRINKNRNKLNSEMRAYLNQAVAITANTDVQNLSFEPVIQQVKSKLNQTYGNVTGNRKLLEETIDRCVSVKEDMDMIPLLPEETISDFDRIHESVVQISNAYTELLDTQRFLSQQIESISYDFEKINERLQDVFELAGLGMSVEMFSHEFDSSIRGIRLKNNNLINKANSITVEEYLKHIHYVNYALDTLRKQMSYFNPGLKFVRSEKHTFSFEQFVKEHKAFYEERCERGGISYNIQITEDFDVTVNRGMLNQVFDNLFNNSEYWLDFSVQKKFIEEKVFTIQSREKGIIIIYDNGIGISEDIESRIFEPFETKKQNGRGLGLYIVANNLKYHSARIRLLAERNKYGNLYKFEIDLSSTIL